MISTASFPGGSKYSTLRPYTELNSTNCHETKDRAIKALLLEIYDIAEDAALRYPKEYDIEQMPLSFSQEEQAKLEHYILFLETDCPIAPVGTPLQRTRLILALVSLGVPFIMFVSLFSGESADWFGVIGISLLLSLSVFSVGLLVVMLICMPIAALRERKELESLGMKTLWPFASVSDLKEALFTHHD